MGAQHTPCNGSALRPPFCPSALSHHISDSREYVWLKIEIGRQAVISSSLLHVSLPALIVLPFTMGSGPILVIDSFGHESPDAGAASYQSQLFKPRLGPVEMILAVY